jgi:two-component system NtrC family sensor kinase
VRAGLRLRLLLVLGALLVIAFVPLFFAVATYTSITLRSVREAHARALGRAIAGHVAEAARRRSSDDLMPLLRAEIGTEGVEAIGVYGGNGRPLARAGNPDVVGLLPETARPGREESFELESPRGRALAFYVPSDPHVIVAVVRTDDDSARLAPLLRLLGLYTLVVAAALLVATHFALTRLIVKPIDALGRAAEGVAGGGRRLAVPDTSVRELADLGRSLHTMTERLLEEEEKLRNKIDEVERATQSLRAAQDHLVRSERLASVGRLAAGLAHEIGNPIAALMGLEDLLLEGGLSDAEQRDFLLRMKKETERIHRILKDLLAFARPGAPVPDETDGAGSVEAAVHDTVALLMPHQALKEVDVALDLHPELPDVALSRERLVQVVLNLVLNAADAVGAGGHVRIAAERSELGVRLRVEDDGPGIDPSVVGRLFEPFVTTKEVGKGTGLGLAVCRGLVESAGGTIGVDASLVRGACFVIELPRASATTKPA